MTDIDGRPQWELHFDEAGRVSGATTLDDIVAGVTDRGVTDLFVFSHGWNNDEESARRLYDAMFPLIGAAATQHAPAIAQGLGYVGVYWPSIWFPDDVPAEPPSQPAGRSDAQSARGTAVVLPPLGATTANLSGAEIAATLRPAYAATPALQTTIDRLGVLIDEGVEGVATRAPQSVQEERVKEFGRLLQTVAPTKPDNEEDSGGNAVVEAGPAGAQKAYVRLSDTMGGAPRPGAAMGAGDIFRKVWHGAKEALRIASFSEMKGRAGQIGAAGLGPLLEKLGADTDVRVHLVGHSFGGRLVSFSLSRLASAGASPVRSLTLIQAAFSHWSFTQDQPWEHPGALAAFADRVKGPLVATFSSHDRAVGSWYPKASVLKRQDNQAESNDFLYRWGGLGGDGFAEATPGGPPLTMGASGADYGLAVGTFSSIDASSVIATTRSFFSGAHSDIQHPEVAWAAVSAAAVGATG